MRQQRPRIYIVRRRREVGRHLLTCEDEEVGRWYGVGRQDGQLLFSFMWVFLAWMELGLFVGYTQGVAAAREA